MFGSPRPILVEPLSSSLLSLLRHELVSPINLIVGYCELLTAEAVEIGDASVSEPLQPIRQLGFSMLRSIDAILLHDPQDRSIADIKELAETLMTPATQLVGLCDSVSLATTSDGAASTFAGDLDRIRLAGRRMFRMARDLADGMFPAEDP